MSERDSPFASELQQAIFEPRRELVHQARHPGVPLRERTIPLGFRLLSVQMVGTLPSGLKLADDLAKTVTTTSVTEARVTMSTSDITLQFRPAIHIDPTLLGEADLSEVHYRYGSDTPTLRLRDVGLSVDPSTTIRNSLIEDYGAAIRSSAFGRADYDPTVTPTCSITFSNLPTRSLTRSRTPSPDRTRRTAHLSRISR